MLLLLTLLTLRVRAQLAWQRQPVKLGETKQPVPVPPVLTMPLMMMLFLHLHLRHPPHCTS